MCTFTVGAYQWNNVFVLRVQPRVWLLKQLPLRVLSSETVCALWYQQAYVYALLTRSCHCQIPAKKYCCAVIIHWMTLHSRVLYAIIQVGFEPSASTITAILAIDQSGELVICINVKCSDGKAKHANVCILAPLTIKVLSIF